MAVNLQSKWSITWKIRLSESSVPETTSKNQNTSTTSNRESATLLTSASPETKLRPPSWSTSRKPPSTTSRGHYSWCQAASNSCPSARCSHFITTWCRRRRRARSYRSSSNSQSRSRSSHARLVLSSISSKLWEEWCQHLTSSIHLSSGSQASNSWVSSFQRTTKSKKIPKTTTRIK